jgi:hypothetical protein
MCPLSIYYVLSTPLAGGARATLQMTHLSSPLSKQCARAAWCTVLIIPYTRSFPCTMMLRRSRVSGRKKIAPAANISSSKYYIRYVPGPTCRGSVPLYMPPLAIKGEACNVTRGSIFRLRLSILKLPQQSNTQWSRVLRFGGPNHSKSSRVHVLDVRLAG